MCFIKIKHYSGEISVGPGSAVVARPHGKGKVVGSSPTWDAKFKTE